MIAPPRCTVCGVDVPDVVDPDDGDGLHCDDCFYRGYGDMLTPGELRGSKLRGPQLRAERDALLASAEAAGVPDDRDPSFVWLVGDRTLATLEDQPLPDVLSREDAIVRQEAFAVHPTRGLA
jgi:hypothetical protein